MKLHENKELFIDVVRASAQKYAIRAVYIEKDFGNKEWMGRSFQDAEIFSAPRKIWTLLSSVYHADFNDMMFGPLPPEEHVLKTLEFLGDVISEFEKKRSRQM